MMYLIPLILSLTVHEFAHAWSAYRLGDSTAQEQGRLTLNPIAHIDPIGTLLLPLLGIPFGWAKPVPVNAARFRRNVTMGAGTMITAAAGPLSNILLAIVCAVSYGFLGRWGADLLAGQPGIGHFLRAALTINVGLAVFNLLPIPPLDGSRVVEGLMPYRYREAWQMFARVGPLLLLVVIFSGGALIGGPIRFAHHLLNQLIWALVNGGST